MTKNRDYDSEYRSYHARPEQIKRRAERNAARSTMVKAGKAKKGDGKDVAHLDNNTAHNGLGNLAIQTKSKNRSFPRNKNAERKFQ